MQESQKLVATKPRFLLAGDSGADAPLIGLVAPIQAASSFDTAEPNFDSGRMAFSDPVQMGISDQGFISNIFDLSPMLKVVTISNGDNLLLNFNSQVGANVTIKVVGDMDNVKSREDGTLMILSKKVGPFAIVAMIQNGSGGEEVKMRVDPVTGEVEVVEALVRRALLRVQLSHLRMVAF